MKPEDRFRARVREFFDSFLLVERDTVRMEYLSDPEPNSYAGLLLGLLRQQRRDVRYYLRRDFGIKVRYFGTLGLSSEQRVVSRKHYPNQSPRTEYERERYETFRNLTALMAWLDLIWAHMIHALDLALRRDEDPGPTMLAAYYECRRLGPLTAAPSSDLESDHALRERSAALVAGWAAAQIKRHGAISDDLLERLIPASLEAWGAMEPNEPMRSGSGRTNFISRVRASLRRFGRGDRKLARERRLVDERLDPTSQIDSDIFGDEDLERARRQLAYIQELVEREGFLSPRQRQTYKLDRKLNGDTDAVAHEMGLDESTVRNHRMHYRRKLKQALKAAGL